jgi:hypothetical protein
MHLTETGMPGYFQITAEDNQFTVTGGQIHPNDAADVEGLISNLAEMLDSAIGFAKDKDMVDRILGYHDLLVDKGE